MKNILSLNKQTNKQIRVILDVYHSKPVLSYRQMNICFKFVSRMNFYNNLLNRMIIKYCGTDVCVCQCNGIRLKVKYTANSMQYNAILLHPFGKETAIKKKDPHKHAFTYRTIKCGDRLIEITFISKLQKKINYMQKFIFDFDLFFGALVDVNRCTRWISSFSC